VIPVFKAARAGRRQRDATTVATVRSRGKKSKPKQITYRPKQMVKTALNKRPQSWRRKIQRRTIMNVISLRSGFVVAALLALNGEFFGTQLPRLV
jgi:hypothetical protein